MRISGEEPTGAPSKRAGIISFFFLAGAAVGLLLGLFEAALLWHSPRIVPLLCPDISYVEWFLAPLVDMACFGLLGLILGWIAARHPRAGKTVTLVQIGISVVAVSVILRVHWLHSRTGIDEFVFAEDLMMPAALLTLPYALLLQIPLKMWRRFGGLIAQRQETMRRFLAWGVSLAAAGAVCGIVVFQATPILPVARAHGESTDSSKNPNIIFVTLDTVRADHLSAYGYFRPTTPNLDRFAHNGVLFENAIAPTSWTLASHASMFTGLLPQQHGADWAIPLASSPWTLAEILRSRGYQTAGFTSNLFYLQKGWGIAQGFEDYVDDSVSLRHNLVDTLFGTAILQPAYEYLVHYNDFDRQNAQQLNQRIFTWFRHRPRQPYFVFINYLDAHEPYLPPAPYNHRFGTISNALAHKLNDEADVSHPPQGFSPQERAKLKAAYDNCLAYLDHQVGDLLALLRQLPGWQDTIVIITSDHGEEFGGHRFFSHGSDVYRAALHVPLIIAGRGVPKGQRISHLVGTRQLFSTVLDLAGGGKTPFSRTSLARFWNPDFMPTPFDDTVVSELVPIDDLHGEQAMITLTTPQFEYIEHRSGRQELYAWERDPQEQNNLATSPHEQAMVESLHDQLLDLVSNATGPWRGRVYLQALGNTSGTSRLRLLFPRPFRPGTAASWLRIGAAQAYFKAQASTPTKPSPPERELMQSLPYQ